MNENSSDPKSLFNLIDNLLNRKKKSPLPDHSSASELAASFNTYFIDKVTVIHQSLEEGNQTQNISAVVIEESRYQIGLRNFKNISEEDVLKFIKKCPKEELFD